MVATTKMLHLHDALSNASVHAPQGKTIVGLMHYGLITGLFSQQEVIAWADREIAAQAMPELFFIELSMTDGRPLQDTLFVLADFLNFDDASCPVRALFGLLYIAHQSGQYTLQQIVHCLWQLRGCPSITEAELNFIYWLDDAIDLAPYYPVDTATACERFLALYQDFILARHASWDDLNERIDAYLSTQSLYL